MESQLESITRNTETVESEDNKQQLTKTTDEIEKNDSSHSTTSSKRSHKTPKKFEDYQPQKRTPKAAPVEAQKKAHIVETQTAHEEAEQKGSPGRYKCDELRHKRKPTSLKHKQLQKKQNKKVVL